MGLLIHLSSTSTRATAGDYPRLTIAKIYCVHRSLNNTLSNSHLFNICWNPLLCVSFASPLFFVFFYRSFIDITRRVENIGTLNPNLSQLLFNLSLPLLPLLNFR